MLQTRLLETPFDDIEFKQTSGYSRAARRGMNSSYRLSLLGASQRASMISRLIESLPFKAERIGIRFKNQSKPHQLCQLAPLKVAARG
jgi:hypothetical protein